MAKIYTIEQYKALVANMEVTKVKYGNKEVEYRPLDDMLRLKTEMEKDLGIIKPSNKRYASHTKGLT